MYQVKLKFSLFWASSVKRLWTSTSGGSAVGWMAKGTSSSWALAHKGSKSGCPGDLYFQLKGRKNPPLAPALTARSNSRAASLGSSSNDTCAIGTSRPPESEQKSTIHRL